MTLKRESNNVLTKRRLKALDLEEEVNFKKAFKKKYKKINIKPQDVEGLHEEDIEDILEKKNGIQKGLQERIR